jgi:type II secretory pathway predicted ATPase ExeA
MLEYGILTRAPITLITGEVGAGKTTLLHQLLRTIGDDVRIGLVSNAHGDRGELLRWVLMALDQEAAASASYVDLFDQFQRFLIGQYAEGRRVILIFDEAQNLSRESLEELRMFTNINSGKDELLQLILVGQPELREIVKGHDLRQFAQRVSSSYHLPSMNRDTLSAYIAHRLSVAGAQWQIFEEDAFDPIFEATRGVPRLVNQLCDLAMLYSYSDGVRTVDGETVRLVLEDGVFFGGGNDPESGPEPGPKSGSAPLVFRQR